MDRSIDKKASDKVDGRKLLVLDCIIFELQRYGGISTYWQELIANMELTDIEKYLLITSRSRSSLEINENKNFGLLEDKKFHRFHPQAVRLNTEKMVTLFHSSYFRVATNSSVKNIVTVHDCIPEYYDRFLRKFYYSRQKKKALKYADAIISVSHNTKKDILKFYPDISPENIHVIHNGINLSTYKKLGDVVDKSASQDLLFVGGRGRHKNFLYALRLMNSDIARQNNLNLIVVGGGDFTSKEKKYINDLNLSQNIIHMTNVTQEGLIDLYRSAFALIYPSFYEGFGIPPVEAMACGCPVICSSSSSLGEVANMAALFIDPKELTTAEAALEKLTDDTTREIYVAAGLKRSKQFCSKLMAEKTTTLYQSVLGNDR